MSTAQPILPSLSPAPTALDIARAELNAAEEDYRAALILRRPLLETGNRVRAARAAYARAHRAEFGQGGQP